MATAAVAAVWVSGTFRKAGDVCCSDETSLALTHLHIHAIRKASFPTPRVTLKANCLLCVPFYRLWLLGAYPSVSTARVVLSKPLTAAAPQPSAMACGTSRISSKQTTPTQLTLTRTVMNAKSTAGTRPYVLTPNGMLLADWHTRLVLSDSSLLSF